LWRRMSDGAGFNDDQAYAMAVDASGNVVVTGYTTNAIASYDFLTIKYNGTNGNELWRAVGDGAAHNIDQAYAVAVDGSDNVVVTGYSANAAGNYDFLTIKYNGATGGETWRAVGDGTAHGNDFAYSLVVDASNNVVVTGYSAN